MSTASAAAQHPDYLSDQIAKEDHFERREFASRLADTIVKRRQEECLTVSIVGSWGNGKSTVLDMMTEELNSRTVAEGTCLQVNFNPWKYSGQDTLLYHLFEAIVKKIDPDLKVLTTWQSMKRNASKARKWVGGIGGVAAHVWAPGSGAVASGLLNAILPEEFKANVDELKKQTSTYLLASKLRLVVLLDDVDRLEAEEILLLFRSLKLVVDLPNTTFVIAMDEDHVSQIIGRQLDGSQETGRKYLEKIINVRLQLPVIPPEVLEEYALELFFKVSKDLCVEISGSDADKMRQIFQELHAPFLRTPRTVKAIAKAFHFSLGLMPSELNPRDVLLLEATKLLHPKLCDKILEVIPHLLIGDHSGLEWTEINKETLQNRAKRILASGLPGDLKEYEDRIIDAVGEWFPQLKTNVVFDAEESQGRQLICSPDYFWRYFSMGIQKKDVHDALVRGWCQLARQVPEKADVSLNDHLRKPYARAFLKKADRFCDEGWAARQAVILSLVRVTSLKLEFQQRLDWKPSFWQVGVELAAGWIKDLPREERPGEAVALVQMTSQVDWNMAFGQLMQSDENVFQFNEAGKSPGLLDEELAHQSLAAYEHESLPDDNDMIRERVWCLYRNLNRVKERLIRLIQRQPRVALQMVAGGCTFSTSGSKTGWKWNGRKGLENVEQMIPRKVLKELLKQALPGSRPVDLKFNPDSYELHTLEEVAWLCLDTIAEAERAEGGA